MDSSTVVTDSLLPRLAAGLHYKPLSLADPQIADTGVQEYIIGPLPGVGCGDQGQHHTSDTVTDY